MSEHWYYCWCSGTKSEHGLSDSLGKRYIVNQLVSKICGLESLRVFKSTMTLVLPYFVKPSLLLPDILITHPSFSFPSLDTRFFLSRILFLSHILSHPLLPDCQKLYLWMLPGLTTVYQMSYIKPTPTWCLILPSPCFTLLSDCSITLFFFFSLLITARFILELDDQSRWICILIRLAVF